MNKTIIIGLALTISFSFGYLFTNIIDNKTEVNVQISASEWQKIKNEKNMKLGAFSISLSVKDLEISRQFYEKMGFTVFAGSMEQNYLIMKNENALIGLFQGMFQGNILTFNPGWNENAQNMETFDDVRAIQKKLKTENITLMSEADENTTGPASLMLTDPDGNLILLDQHR
jgi:predicted lactoylglutathione lyase